MLRVEEIPSKQIAEAVGDAAAPEEAAAASTAAAGTPQLLPSGTDSAPPPPGEPGVAGADAGLLELPLVGARRRDAPATVALPRLQC